MIRIGIDLGGTKIEGIALSADGRAVAGRRIATPREDYDGTVRAVAGLVSALESDAGSRGTVGVGMPGAVSPATGLVKNANSTWLAVVGALLHAGLQFNHWFGQETPDVSLPHLLSLCALVIIVLLISSTLTRRTLFAAGLVALPIAGCMLLLQWIMPPRAIPLTDASLGTTVHLVSSVLAFGLLSIAGLYALFVFVIDHFLRRHHLNPLVRSLPPLEVLEDLLFKVIAAGFILLTVSLFSGIMFINDIFAQHLVHKTILSILAWLVFGVLLWGRWRFGWRGSLAVRLTLAGIVLLLLSYFGSKFVLENLLGRSWQS